MIRKVCCYLDPLAQLGLSLATGIPPKDEWERDLDWRESFEEGRSRYMWRSGEYQYCLTRPKHGAFVMSYERSDPAYWLAAGSMEFFVEEATVMCVYTNRLKNYRGYYRDGVMGEDFEFNKAFLEAMPEDIWPYLLLVRRMYKKWHISFLERQ